MRKRTAAIGVVVVVATAAFGSYLGGSRSESPAEVALRTAPPEPSKILVPVERRVLTSDVVTRGTGAFGSPRKISVASSWLKSSTSVLDHVAVAGMQLDEGGVAATAGGRPVFVLIGAHSMSRDLTPGSIGEDVRQLEAALLRLGFDPGLVDGVFDRSTSEAVQRWYLAAGFEPLSATPDQLVALRARELERATAIVDMVGAADVLTTAETGVLAARSARVIAASHADSARRALGLSQSEAAAANTLAATEVALKRGSLDALRQQAAAAEAANAGSATGDPVAVSAPTASELATAQRELAVAEANRETVRLAGLRTVELALVAIGDADAELVAREASLRATESAVANASVARSARDRVVDLTTSEAARAATAVGVQVPADEIVFVESGPVRVSEPLLGAGDALSGGLMKVTDSTVHVDAALALADVGLVRTGMTVEIDEPDLGISATGTVAEVAATPGTNGVDGFHVYARIDVVSPPPALAGASVRLTIPIETTEGEVLAVPTGAVTLAADGSSRVLVDRGGTPRQLTVEPLLSAQGYISVRPVGGTLVEGDLVVIGQSLRSTTSKR